jgi:putative peptidoglycan lipid II flippase
MNDPGEDTGRSTGGIGKAALVVSAGILLSRVLGMLRNVALAGLLGNTAAGDAFQAAFVIPDVLFYLMAGGYLTVTFIPIITRHMVRGDPEEGHRAFAAVFRPVALAMLVLTVLAMIFAGSLTGLVYPRFDPAQAAEVTRLTRIVLPAQIFFVLGSLWMAVQYAHQRFAIPAVAPVIYNLGIIAGGLISWAIGTTSAAGFAWGAVGGAFVGNFALQWYGARRAGLRWVSGVPLRHPALREYLLLALPLMLGQSIAVLDEQFVRLFGQLSEPGGISALTYARRLNMLPIGVIAQTAGVAAYPYLARLIEEGKLQEMAATVTRTIRYTIFISAPAVAAILALSQPAVRVVYERGEFGPPDTVLTATVLVFYGLSIPAWGAHQIYARAFYARRQMWAPVLIGTAGTLVAIGFYWWLSRFDEPGFAAASTLTIVLYTVILGIAWHLRVGSKGVSEILSSLTRSSIGVAVSAPIAWLVVNWISAGELPGFWGSLGLVVVGATVVMVVYLTTSRLLGSPELRELRTRMK